MSSTAIIRNYIDRELQYTRNVRSASINMDEITLPTGENIIVSYADISITGTDRSKPQIRIFSDKAVEAFKIPKPRQGLRRTTAK